MDDDKVIEAIHRAADDRARADELRHNATDTLRLLCREARERGMPMARIAREARLSRQGLYDLLADQPPASQNGRTPHE
jgi:hypothetical protein